MNLPEIQLLIFTSYITLITILFGWLPSISESWYRFNEKNFALSGVFWLFCFSIGLTLIMTPGWLFQVSGFGLWITGTMAPFKKKWMAIGLLHSVGAYVCILAALIGLGVHRDTWIPLLGFITILVLIKEYRPKNETFWIEISAFIPAIVGLLLTQ
jgi:hypothetical protein